MAETGADGVDVFDGATGENAVDILSNFNVEIVGREEQFGGVAGGSEEGGDMCHDICGEAGTGKGGEVTEFVGEGAEVEHAFGGEDNRLIVVVGSQCGGERREVGARNCNNHYVSGLESGSRDGIVEVWIVITN